jgi:hypothetical protein
VVNPARRPSIRAINAAKRLYTKSYVKWRCGPEGRQVGNFAASVSATNGGLCSSRTSLDRKDAGPHLSEAGRRACHDTACHALGLRSPPLTLAVHNERVRPRRGYVPVAISIRGLTPAAKCEG